MKSDNMSHNNNPTSLDTMDIWIYAFTSVIIISICGLVPIICMPRLQKTRYQNDLLQFLIGLATGTLTADALLHLLPSCNHKQASDFGPLIATNSSTSLIKNDVSISNQNSDYLVNKNNLDSINSLTSEHHESNHHHPHHHDHDESLLGHAHSHASDESFWFGCMALVGIIGFLVLERIMLLLTDVCTHNGHVQASSVADDELDDAPTQITHESHMHDHQNHHQHQHHHLTSKTKSFMFMIITGDGLHNFFDGIAIGVSYGSSMAVGLGTSIAILCHELPHEIGDFAVLIKNGMTIRRAVLYNTLSSVLCLLGATTGVFLGRIDVNWVSALIAGMFLYISLVDMVPQLNCYPGQPALKRVKMLVVQVSGILAGVMIMSLIAIYESRLHSLISSYNRL